MKKILTAFAGIGALLSGQAFGAAFTDEAAWRAAVNNNFALETFDNIAAGSDVNLLNNLGIRFDPLNDGTQPTVQPYGSTGGVVRSGPHNLLNDRDFSLPGRGPITVRPIDAGDFLFALGLWNVGGDDRLDLSFFDSMGNLMERVVSDTGSGFFGIVNEMGASFAVVNFVGGNGYAPTDDWQTATRTTFEETVPVPAALPLFLTALGAGLFGRRLGRRTA